MINKYKQHFQHQRYGMVWHGKFDVPLNTLKVISEMIFPANHLTCAYNQNLI